MKLSRLCTTLLIISLLSACGGGGGGKTLETSVPNTCAANSDCASGQVCQSGACIANSNVDLSSNQTSYQNCAYYGLSDESGDNCSDGTSLTSVHTDTTKWKNFQQIMQIAAAKALLKHNNNNENGSGVTVNIVGSGVTDSGDNIKNLTIQDSPDSFFDCSENNLTNPKKCTDSYGGKTSTFEQLSNGEDLADGTMLASLLSNKEKGMSNDITLKSIQTFVKLSSTYDNSSNTVIYAYNGYPPYNNINHNINQAISLTSKSEIVLFNNQRLFNNQDRTSDTNFTIRYNQGNTDQTKTYTSEQVAMINGNVIDDSFFSDDNNTQNIKTLLNQTDRVFITLVDNVLISAAIYKTNVTENDQTNRAKYYNGNNNTYNNLIAVADVKVTGVTYKDNEDNNSIKEIDTVTIKSSFVSGDCSKFEKENCFIAPGGDGNYAIDKDGSYESFDGKKESAASAYIAGGFALLQNQFSSVAPTNIIAKVRDTATKADKITGCNEDAGNCGSGIPNFYKAAKAVTVNGASVINGRSISSNISQSSLMVAPAFGNGLQSVNSHFADTIYLDDYNFAYSANLDKKINISQNNLSLKNFFNFNNKQVNLLDKFNLTNNLSFDLLSKKQALNYNDLASDISNNFTGSKQNNFIEDSKLTNLKFKHNFANFSVDFAYKTNYQNNNLLVTPAIKSANNYLNLSVNNENHLIAVNYQLNNKLSFANSWLASGETSLYVTKADFSANKNTKLSLSLGFLHENNAILGMKSQGAFGNNSSNSNYINLQFLHKVNNINFFANLAWGKTQAQLAENSLFTKFSDFSSQEMQIVINKKFKRNIEMGFNYVEPLRVTSGQVAVTSQQIKNNKIVFISNDSSIRPDGKERNYEIYFNKNISNDSNLSLNLLRVTEAGHNKKAKDNNMILIKFKKEF